MERNKVYKCTLCPRTFTSGQGLAGHMNAHRYDHVYQSESSPNLRLPSNPAPESARPKSATGVTYYQAPAVQAGFGGSGLRPPPPVNHSLGFARFMGGSQSSSERTVTNPNTRVAAKGGEDEEDVTSETWVEVDTELRLGRG